MTWVLDRLKDGEPVPQKVLAAEAAAAGISKGALKNARERFKVDGRVRTVRKGGLADTGHWEWTSVEAERARPRKRPAERIDDVLADLTAEGTPSPADVAAGLFKPTT